MCSAQRMMLCCIPIFINRTYSELQVQCTPQVFVHACNSCRVVDTASVDTCCVQPRRFEPDRATETTTLVAP
ncbi:hypothetical protein COO60DRAFT_1489899 [Scenedesmus sp. NREL 46B-D3]|nr:hypothetical protein COO60DRAFT_1489899 [Scenedesmus sp. NREL 46B-D3]